MSGEEFVKLLADARAEFERIGKRVRISADGDGYQVNLIQGSSFANFLCMSCFCLHDHQKLTAGVKDNSL